jgi:hypothetical protein
VRGSPAQTIAHDPARKLCFSHAPKSRAVGDYDATSALAVCADSDDGQEAQPRPQGASVSHGTGDRLRPPLEANYVGLVHRFHLRAYAGAGTFQVGANARPSGI